MHVRFTEDFNFVPAEDRRTAIYYKSGWSGLVRKTCGEEAIALGKAVRIEAPKRTAGQ